MRIAKFVISLESDVSFKVSGWIGNTVNSIMVGYYDENDVFISGEIPGRTPSSSIIDYELTVPINAKWIYVVGATHTTLPSIKEIFHGIKPKVSELDIKVQNVESELNDQLYGGVMFNPSMPDFRKSELKILDLGNSYTLDAQHYLPDLITAAGITEDDFSLYTLYRGSGSFKSLYNCYNDRDARTYEVRHIAGTKLPNITEGEGASYNGSKLRDLLNNASWDIILIH